MNKRLLVGLAFVIAICSETAWSNFCNPLLFPTTAAFFGMHFASSSNWPGTPTIIGAMGKCAGTTWPWIESSRGTYNWANLDFCLSVAQAHGVSLFYSSDCTSNSAPAGCSGGAEPAGLGIPSWTNCSNLATDYAAFFTAFLARYGTQIPIIELWNEPGSVGCSTAQFVAAINAADAVIRSAEPTIIILAPSFVGSVSSTPIGLTAFYANGGTQNVDGWSMHVYTENDSPNQPESFLSDFATETSAMSSVAPAVLAKPLWNTEGAAFDTSVGLPAANIMAAYIARYHLLTWASGVARDYWYEWDAFGTIMGTAQAVTAYDQTENWLIGSSNPLLTINGTVYAISMAQGSNKAQAVWNTAGSSSYTVPSGYGHYKDLAGNTSAIVGGTVTIGVEPVLLVP